MDFLDFIRKVHEERKARGFVIKGGKGSGWFAPPKGTHGSTKQRKGTPTIGRGQIPSDAGAIGAAKAEKWYTEGIPNRDWRNASDEVRAKVKQEIISTLAKKTDTPEEYINDFIKQWAHSSNDEDMRSLAIQEDAAKQFSVPLSKFTKDRIETIRAEVAFHGEGPLPPEWRSLLKSERQQTILKAMYEHTQSQLAEAGFKPGQTIRLYRGVKLPVEIADKWNEGDAISIKGNALQSWTLSKNTAQYFAGGWQVGGIAFAMDVPVGRIVGTARTGFGCLTEGEFVIMGGSEDIGEVAYKAW